jgi:hypothetical protein
MNCPRHKHCAYTGTEPERCRTCHSTTAKCSGTHGGAPSDGSWRLGTVAKPTNATLKAGQPLHPREATEARSSSPQPLAHAA